MFLTFLYPFGGGLCGIMRRRAWTSRVYLAVYCKVTAFSLETSTWKCEVVTKKQEVVKLRNHQDIMEGNKRTIGCSKLFVIRDIVFLYLPLWLFKLVANGKLKASRLSSRMAFARKSEDWIKWHQKNRSTSR